MFKKKKKIFQQHQKRDRTAMFIILRVDNIVDNNKQNEKIPSTERRFCRRIHDKSRNS